MIKIDLNIPGFQEDFFSMGKEQQSALLRSLKKISKLTWNKVYVDKGLHWEAVSAKKDSQNERIYTFRFSKKYRAVATREDNTLRLQRIHVDHDGAYK